MKTCKCPAPQQNFWMFRLSFNRIGGKMNAGASMYRYPSEGTPLRAACLDAYGLASNTGLWQ